MRMNICISAILLSVIVERKNYRLVNGHFSRGPSGFRGPGSTWVYGEIPWNFTVDIESGRRDSESSSSFWMPPPGSFVYASGYSDGLPSSESLGGSDSVERSDLSLWTRPDESIIYIGQDDYGYEVSDSRNIGGGGEGNLDSPPWFQPDGSIIYTGQDMYGYDFSGSRGTEREDLFEMSIGGVPLVQDISVYDGSSSAGSIGGLESTAMRDESGGISNSSSWVQTAGNMSSPRQDDSGNNSSPIFGSMWESSSGRSGEGEDNSNSSVRIQLEESSTPFVQSNPEDGGSSIFESMEGNSSSVSRGAVENLNSSVSIQPQGSTTLSVQGDSGNGSSSSDGSLGAGVSSDMNGGDAGNSNSSLWIQPQGFTTSSVQVNSGNVSSSSNGNMGGGSNNMNGGGVGNSNSSLWIQPQGSISPSVQGNPGNGGDLPSAGSMGGGNLLSTIGEGGGNLVSNSLPNGGMGAVGSTNSLPPGCFYGKLGRVACRGWNAPATSSQPNTASTNVLGPGGEGSFDNPPALLQNETLTNILDHQ